MNKFNSTHLLKKPVKAGFFIFKAIFTRYIFSQILILISLLQSHQFYNLYRGRHRPSESALRADEHSAIFIRKF